MTLSQTRGLLRKAPAELRGRDTMPVGRVRATLLAWELGFDKAVDQILGDHKPHRPDQQSPPLRRSLGMRVGANTSPGLLPPLRHWWTLGPAPTPQGAGADVAAYQQHGQILYSLLVG